LRPGTAAAHKLPDAGSAAQDDENSPTTIFRALDDALIDRVFQPIVNRLQVSHVAHVAIPCYALYVGAQAGRALVLHAQGLFGARAPDIAFDVAAACVIYGLAIVLNRNARARPNPVRYNPACRLYRLASLLLTLLRFSIVPFIRHLDAETLLSWGGFGLWAAGLYFESCDSPPPRPRRKAIPDAVPNAA